MIAVVVDDDERIRNSLENLLESAGHTVRSFASADTFLESGDLAGCDCLISDIDLPKIDGFELSRLVCAARPELPVILITGHQEIGDQQLPSAWCHLRLFKKPFNAEELLTAMMDAVGGARR
jgi:FixJ family two-component response regulator